jgi:murein L,D-transpeptidase YcbB/YkuD
VAEAIYSAAIMSRHTLAPVLLAAVLWAAGAVPLAASAVAEEASLSVRAVLEGEGVLPLAGRRLDRGALATLYHAREYAPIWVTAPEREAALVKALAEAPAHGLDAAAFVVPAAAPAERDLLLTDAFLRYGKALAQGRVSSAKLENDWALTAPDFDAAAALDAAASGDVGAVLAALAPAAPGYKRLQAALVQYRALDAGGGWPQLAESGKLKRGDSGAAVAALHQRLAAEGYLAEATGKEFDAALQAALKQFQAQHGIDVDGQVGHATYLALNVTAAEHVEQVRINLERWREMPRDWPETRIEVNVPAAWLTVIENGTPGLAMRAIVGAEKHPTPVLQARMNAVLFNPPWNIPTSIIKKEILPHLKRDPNYLDRNHYVYVTHNGASGIQQLPGPDNALGRIKFELPNEFDVYLHDTPSHPLFSRAIRTLSHGCVRLENPRELAVYVLTGAKANWSLKEIDDAIAVGDTRRVQMAHSIPVYLLYWTAFVDDRGAVEFRDDIYGRDLRLAAAMERRDAAERIAAIPAAVPPPVPGPTPAPASTPTPAPALTPPSAPAPAPNPTFGPGPTTLPISAPADSAGQMQSKTAAD